MYEILRRQTAEDFPQRADTDTVAFLQIFKLELLPGSETAEDNVRADATVAEVADGLNVLALSINDIRISRVCLAWDCTVPAQANADYGCLIQYRVCMVKYISYFDSAFII